MTRKIRKCRRHIQRCFKDALITRKTEYGLQPGIWNSRTIPNAVGQENIYVALDENEKCLGFIYYMTNGVFGSYPYLHIVAVKEEYRSFGIGKQLIKFFEDNASDSSSAEYFLTVDDFNPGAKKLYENLGYKCVGELPDFYKKGINCYLMMKRRGKRYEL